MLLEYRTRKANGTLGDSRLAANEGIAEAVIGYSVDFYACFKKCRQSELSYATALTAASLAAYHSSADVARIVSLAMCEMSEFEFRLIAKRYPRRIEARVGEIHDTKKTLREDNRYADFGFTDGDFTFAVIHYSDPAGFLDQTMRTVTELQSKSEYISFGFTRADLRKVVMFYPNASVVPLDKAIALSRSREAYLSFGFTRKHLLHAAKFKAPEQYLDDIYTKAVAFRDDSTYILCNTREIIDSITYSSDPKRSLDAIVSKRRNVMSGLIMIERTLDKNADLIKRVLQDPERYSFEEVLPVIETLASHFEGKVGSSEKDAIANEVFVSLVENRLALKEGDMTILATCIYHDVVSFIKQEKRKYYSQRPTDTSPQRVLSVSDKSDNIIDDMQHIAKIQAFPIFERRVILSLIQGLFVDELVSMVNHDKQIWGIERDITVTDIQDIVQKFLSTSKT